MRLGVFKDRQTETVQAFRSEIPRPLCQTIHAVGSDMYEGLVKAAKEVFGKRVQVVSDRLPGAKRYRRGWDSLRQQALKRLQATLSEEEYSPLQGAMWALRKKEEKLTDEDTDVLVCVFAYSPCLKTA